MNPVAPAHLPVFITTPGQSDWLLTAMLVFLLVTVLSVGILYFKLHALPEHMAHQTNRVQLELVAVLGLISLFTHNHLFWIAGLLLAMVELPDFSTPFNSIALSLEKISGRDRDAAPASRWNDLLSDDTPPDLPRQAPPPPAAGQTGKEV